MVLRALLSALLAAALAHPAVADWSVVPDAVQPTAQGCAATFTEETWVCLYIRCGDDGAMELLFSVGAGEVSGPATLSVDGDAVTVFLEPLAAEFEEIPPAVSRTPLPPDLLALIKSGRDLTISGQDLAEGYDVVTLAGAPQAVRAVERSCGL